MYNDDYQQRQREDSDRRQREDNDRQREDSDRRQREDNDRQREDSDRRQREQEQLNRCLAEERQAQIKRGLDAAAEELKRDLELKARQLKADLDKKSAELKEDLDARAEKGREDFNKGMDRKIALKHAEDISQQLRERRMQIDNANYSSSATGIIADSTLIVAAMRAMTDVNSNESSTFLERNNVARTLSDLSPSGIETIYSEIKLQKQSNADEMVASKSFRKPSESIFEEKFPKNPKRPSILDEKWNHGIKFKSVEQLQRYKSVITKIPEFRWVTVLNSTTSSLNVNDWKYPIKLSDDTIFGIGHSKKTNCQIIRKYYYKQLESVIKKQGADFILKDDFRVILKLYPGVTECEIVDPIIAVQRIPITIDLIDLFRHGDLINFNLKNQPNDSELTEGKLQHLFANGLIYEFTRWRCDTMESDTFTQAQKTGERLGRTALEYIENLVDGKDWKHHWVEKYGKPPSQSEELRAMGPSLVILTDDDIHAKEKEEKEALWKSRSFIEKVKHTFTNRS